MEDRLYDVQQAANKLSVSVSTVYRLIKQGDIEASRHGTKHCIRITESSIASFQEKRTAEYMND